MRLLRNIFAFLFVALLMTVALGGCTGKHKTESAPDNESQVKGTFVIALLPERNIFLQKRRYQPLAEYLSKRLHMNVRTKLLDSYEAVYSQMLDRSIDAAFFGALSYVAMHSKLPLDPIARPLLKNGKSTYRSMIFALKGRGITEDVVTWKGKRIAFISKSTTSGYLFPVWHLRTKGIANIGKYFTKVIYAGSNDAAIAEVMDGRADIGCVSVNGMDNFLHYNPLMQGKFVTLAESPPFPSNTLGVREDIDPTLERKLKAALIGMDGTEEGRKVLAAVGAKRFIETSESEYGAILGMLKTIGIRPDDIALEAIGQDRASGAEDIVNQ
jgi:phosphonate transport system substrate-binding protein